MATIDRNKWIFINPEGVHLYNVQNIYHFHSQ